MRIIRGKKYEVKKEDIIDENKINEDCGSNMRKEVLEYMNKNNSDTIEVTVVDKYSYNKRKYAFIEIDGVDCIDLEIEIGCLFPINKWIKL